MKHLASLQSSSRLLRYVTKFSVWKLIFMGIVVQHMGIGGLYANNIRITGEPVLTLNAGADSVDIGFRLSWENSWRDEFNWDAAWVFVKYKKENAITAWEHLNMGSVVVPSDLTYDFGKSGGVNAGVFIYRSAKGGGAVSDKEIHVKVGLNQFSGVTADDIRHKKVYVAVSGIEMVYIPYGGYYLGDGKSHRSFRSVQQRIIPAEDDIIGTDPAFEYSCIPMPYWTNGSFPLGSGKPENAVDRINNSLWADPYTNVFHISIDQHPENGHLNNSWIVKFDVPKVIRTIGVSGVTNVTKNRHNASTDWYLLASNDSLNWDTLQQIKPEEFLLLTVSYPVQHAIKVKKQGAYQYYRLYFPKMAEVGHGVMIPNIAMSEKDLYPDATEGYLVESEKVVMGKGLNQLYAEDGDTWPNGAVFPDAYPKGYRGFYCMKYEVSQEQYVSFLNMLDRTQQAAHIGNVLDELKKGDYVFGEKSRPNARNGICVFSNIAGKPALFANNLNPSEPYYGEDDGQTIACNYLTPADLLAYCDWAGLRPMSEMEYEKVCRRPYPQYSLEGEYAWNSRELTLLTGLSELVSAGTENETASGKNANAGNKIGPVRCGSFGLGSGLQSKAGAAFWGVMEMSGNLGELCYSAASNGRGFNAADAGASHGNGVLAAGGLTDMTLWPAATTAAAFCLRGGSFAGADSLLQVSDRSVLSVSGERDSTVGFRGVRTFSSERISVEGGAIACENGQLTDTACPGTPLRILSQAGGSVSGMNDVPVSYIWYIDNQVIPGESGAELSYNFPNAGAAVVEYTVKRKAVSAVGEAIATQEVKVKVPNLTLKLDKPEVSIDYNSLATSVTVSSVQTGLTLSYQWRYSGQLVEEGAVFAPLRDHFRGATGNLNVICQTNILNCEAQTNLNVFITNERVRETDALTMDECGQVLVVDRREAVPRYYSTVKIEDQARGKVQCWMGKNMNIGELVVSSDWDTHTRSGIQKMCYQQSELYCSKYGASYRWEEAVYGENNGTIKYVEGTDVVQGICPDGWHVPSDEEFKVLEMAAGMTEAEANAEGGRGSIAHKLKKCGTPADFDGYNWNPTTADCNALRFNWTAEGYRNETNGIFYLNGNGHIWTSTLGSGGAWRRYCLTDQPAVVFRSIAGTAQGDGVRCIKN